MGIPGLFEILLLTLPIVGLIIIIIAVRKAGIKDTDLPDSDFDYSSFDSYESNPNPFKYRGRLQRRNYLLHLAIIFFPIYFIDQALNETNPFLWLIAAGLISFPQVKRLHDANLSGVWYWFGIIPLLNIPLNFYLLFGRGSVGPNQYGPDPRDTRVNDDINTEETNKGLKSSLSLLLIASLFTINATATNEHKIIENGFQVYDVILPFPGTPSETKQNMGGEIILANYVYSPDSSHLNYASLVYENLPNVENPTATILSGFTRGHNILAEQEVQLSHVSGTYVKLAAETPRKATWNAIAFEYKGNVYIWMVTFEPHNANGNEDDHFLSDLKKIEFK